MEITSKQVLAQRAAQLRAETAAAKQAIVLAKKQEKYQSDQRLQETWKNIYNQISNPNVSGLYNLKRIKPPYDWGYTDKEWAQIMRQISVATRIMKQKYGGPVTTIYPG